MWAIKDSKGNILPLYGFHFTRGEVIRSAENSFGQNWDYFKRLGWKSVKVRIKEVIDLSACFKFKRDENNTET